MKQKGKSVEPKAARRIWRLAAIVICGGIGLAAVICAVAAVLILRVTPPPAIHTDPAAAKRLQQRLEEAQIAASRGVKGAIQADETELNSVLETYLQRGSENLPRDSSPEVRDMKLKLIDDRVQAHLLLNVRGKDISLDCEGKIHAQSGYLEFEPISAKVGALAIPASSLKRAVRQFVAVPENREQLRLPRNVRDIRIENGKILVVYN